MTSCVSEFTTLGFYCGQEIPRNRCCSLNRRSFSLILWQIPFKYRFCLLTRPFHSISLRIDEERSLKNLLRFQTKRSYIMKQHLTHSCVNHPWTAANLSFETNMPHSFWPLLFSLLPRCFFFHVQLPHRGITEDSRHSGGIGTALWWAAKSHRSNGTISIGFREFHSLVNLKQQIYSNVESIQFNQWKSGSVEDWLH